MRLSRKNFSSYIIFCMFFIQILSLTACNKDENNTFNKNASIHQNPIITQDKEKTVVLDGESSDSLVNKNADKMDKNEVHNLRKRLDEVQVKKNEIKKNKNYKTIYNNEEISSIKTSQILKKHIESIEEEELQLLDEINKMLYEIENYRRNSN